MHSDLEEAENKGIEEFEQKLEFEEDSPDKIQALRNQEYYGTNETTDRLYKESKAGKIFYHLLALILDPANILLAFRNIKTNRGANTPGIDGVTMRDLGLVPRDTLVDRVKKMLNGIYVPQPVRRVYIPKLGSDKKRPLGIPCALDKLIQQSIKQILEPILEAKFHKHSYGFRPDRSAKHALARCYALAQQHGYHYVVDVDIRAFFDNVDHSKLLKILWKQGIRDKKLLSIIKAILKAPIILPNGGIEAPDKGTPQGGVLSPLLANAMLNELDWWISSQWETFPAKKKNGKPYSSDNARYKAQHKSGLKQIYIVRYADDFKIFAKTREEAERALYAVKSWLEEELKLEVSQEKTKIVNLRKKCSTFLGIKFKLHKKGEKFVIVSHITKKAATQIKDKLVFIIKGIQHPTEEKNRYQWISHYNSAVMGYHEYYNMATHISKDLGKIAYTIDKILYNRFFQFQKDSTKGMIEPKSAIARKYGKSKQLRFIDGMPIVPIGYVQHRQVKSFPQDLTRFNAKGRALLHTPLGISLIVVLQLLHQPTYDRSIQYCDNRASKYFEQYGLCAITGIQLDISTIHCHHIIPKNKAGPDDSYSNLLIVHEDVHRLIHAKEESTMCDMMLPSDMIISVFI